MKRKFILVLFIVLLCGSEALFAQTYIGAGLNYVTPLSKFKEVNKPTFGWNVQVESRNFCKLWYGLRVDYFNLEKADTLTTDYYKNFILLSPQIRYNFTNCNDYKKKLIPYIQALFTLSSITGTDEASKLGLGGSVGGGITYGFSLFKTCFLLDLNVLYNADNFIAKVETRPSLESVTASINLSVRI